MSIRLLNTETLELEEFFDSTTPPYAILSHTWGSEEVSFVEMENHDETKRYQSKAGFKKILNFCAMAKSHGFAYGWADSCCIDKRSSAELSQAINSMYRYYYNAAECFVYLEDVFANIMDQAEQATAIKNSRWFTRGWTLQELIASKTRCFFDHEWSSVGNSVDFNKIVAEVTRIDEQVLGNRDMISQFCVAERMSWASKRQTTRSEDIAYSLMGLFNVNMPILYGEGTKKAFRRLQAEIMQTSFDQTIFAWRGIYESSGLLAASPADFLNTPQLGLWSPSNLSPYSMTNVGVSTRLVLIEKCKDELVISRFSGAQSGTITTAALQCDIKLGSTWKVLTIYLKAISGANFIVNGKYRKAFRRVRCAEWLPVAGSDLTGQPYEDVFVLEDEHYELLSRSREDNRKRWETSS